MFGRQEEAYVRSLAVDPHLSLPLLWPKGTSWPFSSPRQKLGPGQRRMKWHCYFDSYNYSQWRAVSLWHVINWLLTALALRSPRTKSGRTAADETDFHIFSLQATLQNLKWHGEIWETFRQQWSQHGRMGFTAWASCHRACIHAGCCVCALTGMRTHGWNP